MRIAKKNAVVIHPKLNRVVAADLGLSPWLTIESIASADGNVSNFWYGRRVNRSGLVSAFIAQ